MNYLGMCVLVNHSMVASRDMCWCLRKWICFSIVWS
jgi:hypothetical protein